MTELKRCPFCKSTRVELVTDSWDAAYVVECRSCRARGPWKHTRALAEAAWNQCAADSVHLAAPVNAAPPGAEADARDAARYRWLRAQSWPWGQAWYSLQTLDAAIDAALQEQKPGSQP